jgi:wobble nucleotide-excising tRNase
MEKGGKEKTMTQPTVKSWRDDVSFKLGRIMESQDNMHTDIKKTNGKIVNHEERITTIETKESNRVAVRKYMAGVWAMAGGVIVYALQKLAPLAWSMFK